MNFWEKHTPKELISSRMGILVPISRPVWAISLQSSYRIKKSKYMSVYNLIIKEKPASNELICWKTTDLLKRVHTMRHVALTRIDWRRTNQNRNQLYSCVVLNKKSLSFFTFLTINSSSSEDETLIVLCAALTQKKKTKGRSVWIRQWIYDVAKM